MTERRPQTPSIPEVSVAHFVPNKDHGSPEIREALMKYRPVNVLPADWNRVKDFCRQAILDYAPVNARVAAEMLSTVTLFVLWATREEHAPLNRDGLFHPALMGRYLRSRVTKKDSGAYRSLHSRLFRVASAVADVEHNRKKRGHYAVPVHEYTAAELADLESWVGGHRTKERRQQAQTTLALMGGAGLWTNEALSTTGADIVRSAQGYSIRVGGRYPRIVPVLDDFSTYLDAVVPQLTDHRYALFPNGATADSRGGSLRLLYRGTHPALNPQWLRDTWVLRQLRHLPISVVMQAAGMPDVSALRRYLPHASLPYDDWESALRNPAACTAGMDSADNRASETAALAVAPQAGRRTRTRPTEGNDYRRRPPRKLHGQTLATGSTARPEQRDSEGRRVDGERQTSAGRIDTLDSGRGPELPRRKSRYETLPQGAATFPEASKDPTSAAQRNQTDADASTFEVLRAKLLADVRQSTRGGKR